ncbi:MAG: tRNA (adenosine(37)-N6)-dimethylallyltransferase MiaA [Planctomycetales bacterium]
MNEPADANPHPRTFPPIDSDCWILTGPTASGKSAVALALSERLNAEILSMDSMAVYRKLNVGTAKPTRTDQAKVPHHLIDLVDPDQDFSVAQYAEAARDAVQEIKFRGKVALFVGGTPLYLKVLLRGVFEGPAPDWEFRQTLEASAGDHPDSLHERLAKVDPETATKLHPHDLRRVIRALEVLEKTGEPISKWQRQFDRERPPEDCRVFLLQWPREQSLERIDARVLRMFDEGLVDEVQDLLNQGVEIGRTARQALGYREVLEHLEGGTSLEATVVAVQNHTHRFARRQRTWFRSMAECRPLDRSDARSVEEVVEEILRQELPPRT